MGMAPTQGGMYEKEAVQYSDGMQGKYCKTCKFFRPQTSRCLRVKGIIDPNKWCQLWRKKN